MADGTVTQTARPPMRAVLATGLGVAGLAVSIIGLLVWAGQGFKPLPTGIAQVPLLPAIVYTAVGALLAARVPANPVGWAFLTGGLAFTLILPVELLVAAANQTFRQAPPLTTSLAWLVSSFATPVLVGALAIAGLLFPDGRSLSARWRRLALLTAAAALTLGLSAGLDPAGLVWYPTIGNPFRAPSAAAPILSMLRVAAVAVLIASIIGVIVAQASRYRHGDAVTRAQLRWVLSAATLEVALFIPFFVIRYTTPAGEAIVDGLIVIGQLALVLLPLAAALAITRYHLYGIDVLIGRTLVYVPLMGALGGLYALTVAVFQRVFTAITGETSDVAFLLAVFLIAAAFTPMRKALEGVVDRWARPAVDRGRGGPVDVPAEEASKLHETAARLISLQRLEERLASGEKRPGALSGRRLDIDGSGRVGCPHGTDVPFTNCLACEHLVAITTSPAAVVCDDTPVSAGGA